MMTTELMNLNNEELEQVNGGATICLVGFGFPNPFVDDDRPVWPVVPDYCQMGIVNPINEIDF